MGYLGLLVPQACDQCGGDGARGTLGEVAGFRRALPRAIANGVDIREARLERLGPDWHIPILGHAAIFEDFRGAVCWHAKEEVVGKLAAVVDDGDPALCVDRLHFAVGDEGVVLNGHVRPVARLDGREMAIRGVEQPGVAAQGDPG